jgi:hypothetical protein
VRLIVREAGHNDNVLAVLPIDRRCDAVFRRQLQRVNHPQDLRDKGGIIKYPIRRPVKG